jgi:hypothetical protein
MSPPHGRPFCNGGSPGRHRGLSPR